MRGTIAQALRAHAATIVAGVVVLAVLVLAFVALRPTSAASRSADVVIHDADGRVYHLPLDTDAHLEVSTSLGKNVVVVENGTARISQADCPHKSCMEQKPISAPGEQLICLPHKLWVEVVRDGDTGQAQLDESAVTWDDADDVDVVSR